MRCNNVFDPALTQVELCWKLRKGVIDEMSRNMKKWSSIQIIMFAFLLTIIIGSILLSLPISSANGKSVSYVDALFTATTATCVTGLVTLPTVSTWSIFGQIVILLLIQIGGSVSLWPASLCIPRPNLPVTPGVSWLPTFSFQFPIMKRTSFGGVSSKREGSWGQRG